MQDKIFADVLKRVLVEIMVKTDHWQLGSPKKPNNFQIISSAVIQALKPLGYTQLEALAISQPSLLNQYPNRKYIDGIYRSALIKENLWHVLVDKIITSCREGLFDNPGELKPLIEEIDNSSEYRIRMRELSKAEDTFYGNI